MTPQEIFDKAATHLLTQNSRSIIPGTDTCAYRGEGGKKCAVGAVIDDADYREDFEGSNARVVAECIPKLAEHAGLLCELQQIHDGCHEISWPRLLRDLAYRRDMKHDVLDAHALAARTAEAL
jgi:hypothetical protein